ncbi:sensor histidine kinase [Williamsia soli]|uniref:sensor histidine kinase n=1 Tax=Williamsia soli TaxID=364929 RepID=UPI001A9CD21A|nr:histidine kinase [Williamsia soli]
MKPFRELGLRRSDVAVVIVVAVVVLVGSFRVDHGGADSHSIDALAIALGVIGALSLGLSRRYPQVMIAIAAATVFTYLARSYPGGPVLLVGPVSMALAGYRASRIVALVGAVVMAVAVMAGAWVADGDLGIIGVAGPAWAFALTLAGMLLAARTERVAAQKEREELRRQQASTDERLGIARDLHDSVAHALATINVQSGVAAHLLDRQPHQAKAALEAIRQASSEVLDELAMMLETLRDSDHTAPRTPTAGLPQVTELVERARRDGVTIRYDVVGDIGAVPSAESTAGYRVIQESLNNVRRHAGPAAAVTVGVTVASPNMLSVKVIDDGGGRFVSPQTTSSTGLGLIGMRERVESTGGRLTVGADPDGPGYRVAAHWD